MPTNIENQEIGLSCRNKINESFQDQRDMLTTQQSQQTQINGLAIDVDALQVASFHESVSAPAPVALIVPSQVYPVVAYSQTIDAGKYEIKLAAIWSMTAKDDQVNIIFESVSLGNLIFSLSATDKIDGSKEPFTYVFPYVHAGGVFDLAISAALIPSGGGTATDATIDVCHIMLDKKA